MSCRRKRNIIIGWRARRARIRGAANVEARHGLGPDGGLVVAQLGATRIVLIPAAGRRSMLPLS